MPRIRALNPGEAKRTLVGKFEGTQGRPGLADRLRQLHTKFGARPSRLFMVWVVWDGEERGEGNERVHCELEILPTPKIVDLTSVALNPYSAGKLPVGSIRVDEVSASIPEDLLLGRNVPGGGPLPQPFDFFFEVRDDGRDGADPLRQRYRLMATPSRRATNVSWSIMLERASEDRTRKGTTSAGVIPFDET